MKSIQDLLSQLAIPINEDNENVESHIRIYQELETYFVNLSEVGTIDNHDISHFLECIAKCKVPAILSYAYLALGSLLYNRGGILSKFHDSLLGESSLLGSACSGPNLQLRRIGVQCLRNVCMGLQVNKTLTIEHAQWTCQTCIAALQNNSHYCKTIVDHVEQHKLWIAALQCLHSIFCPTFPSTCQNLGSIFGALKAHMGCSLPGSAQLPCYLTSGIGLANTLTQNNIPQDAVSAASNLPSYFNIRENRKGHENKSVIKRRKAKLNKRERMRLKDAAKVENNRIRNGTPDSNSDESSSCGSYKLSDTAAGNQSSTSDSERSGCATNDNPKLSKIMDRLSLNYDLPVCHQRENTLRFVPAWQRATMRSPQNRNGHISSSSEGDQAGASDRGDGSAKRELQNIQRKIRELALGLLQKLTKNSAMKKVLPEFWFNFLPEGNHFLEATNSGLGLGLLLVKEPNSKLRNEILKTISCFISSARGVLVLAKFSEKKTAFTSVSAQLASSLSEIHKNLLYALVAEKYPMTVLQILKCLASVIALCNYSNLEPNLLVKISQNIRSHLMHKDPNVRVACFTCYSAILSRSLRSYEIEAILNPPDISNNSPTLTPTDVNATFDKSRITVESENLHVPWLVQVLESVSGAQSCWILDQKCQNPLPVRLEALQAVAALLDKHNEIFRVNNASTKRLWLFVCHILTDSDRDVRLHGYKLLAKCLKRVFDDDLQQLAAMKFLSLPCIRAIYETKEESEDSSIVAVCACLECFNEKTFLVLSPADQDWFLRCPFQLASHGDTKIVCCAFALLTHILNFSVISENEKFMAKSCDMIFEHLNRNPVTPNVVEKALTALVRLVSLEKTQKLWGVKIWHLSMEYCGMVANGQTDTVPVGALKCALILASTPNFLLEHCDFAANTLLQIAVLFRPNIPQNAIDSCELAALAFSNQTICLKFPHEVWGILKAVLSCICHAHLQVQIAAFNCLMKLPQLPKIPDCDENSRLLQQFFPAVLEVLDSCLCKLEQSQQGSNFADYQLTQHLGELAFSALIHLLPLFEPSLLVENLSCFDEKVLKMLMLYCETHRRAIFNSTNADILVAEYFRCVEYFKNVSAMYVSCEVVSQLLCVLYIE